MVHDIATIHVSRMLRHMTSQRGNVLSSQNSSRSHGCGSLPAASGTGAPAAMGGDPKGLIPIVPGMLGSIISSYR